MKRFSVLLIFLIILLPAGLALGEEGDCLEGDCINGIGTFKISRGSHNGAIYKGEFKDGKRHGQGTIIYPDGSEYVGQWQNNSPNGQGTLTYFYGEIYVGEFRNGMRQGIGSHTYGNIMQYEGEWKLSLLHSQPPQPFFATHQ